MKLLVDGEQVAVKKALEIIWESEDGENTLHLHACEAGIAIQEFAFELLVGEFHCISSEISGFCAEPCAYQFDASVRELTEPQRESRNADRLLDLLEESKGTDSP